MKSIITIFIFSITIHTVSAQTKKTNINALPIGVFDSGTGGLTVLNAILSLDYFNNVTGEPKPDGKPDFEKEYFQFLADQANMPYGNYAAENKTDLLKEHILKNVDFLLGKNYSLYTSADWESKPKPNVKMIVVACNTATAYALPEMKAYLKTKPGNITCIGVIDAGAKAALEWQQKNGEGLIGVFATAGTVASDGYPRTISAFAKALGIKEPVIMSQGGAGLAESIDRDWAYFVDTLNAIRNDYKGPSIKNKNYTIDTSLLTAYNFNKAGNKLLCEYDDKGSCLDMQLNDPANYVRYHLVGLLENILKSNTDKQMNTLILGCTHYPFMKDTIRSVLNELYNYQTNGNYRYQKILARHVELIDPAVETAREAYLTLRKQKLQNYSKKLPTRFYISVPNTSLPEVELQPDGWFTYQYKYGRVAGANKAYIKVVPFDNKNISEATYSRFRQSIPKVYAEIQNASAPSLQEQSALKRNKIKG